MVSIYNFNCNCVSQDSYDTAFFSLDLTSLICPAFQHRPVIPSFCLYNPHNLNGCACSRTLNWLQEVIIMTQQAQQEIALARYGAIAPLISGQADNYKSNKEFYDAVSLKGKSRKLDPDAQERIRYYKTNYPHINEVWCAYRN